MRFLKDFHQVIYYLHGTNKVGLIYLMCPHAFTELVEVCLMWFKNEQSDS
jgi:hypothetical protein